MSNLPTNIQGTSPTTAGSTFDHAAMHNQENALINAHDALLSGISGAVAGFDTYYKQLAANPDSIITGSITRDANDAATSAPVTWPDGSPGTFAATTVSSSFPGAVDAYTITYGSPVTRTYTQSTVTRNADGAVTNRPAITVS